MKKLLLAILALSFIGTSVAQSPFDLYQGEICDEGTVNFDFKIDKEYSKGLMLRLNLYGIPADSIGDTLTVVWATRVSNPDQSGTEEVTAVQAWQESEDTLMAKAYMDTATAILVFPVDSIAGGYNGVYLGDLIRIKFVNVDTLLTDTGTSWCDSTDTSMKWQLLVGYF